MRKADKKRHSENIKLKKHRKKYIRQEKKLAKKQQKQFKKEISGWKKNKRAKRISLFHWFNSNKISFNRKEKTRLRSRFGNIRSWIFNKLDKIRLKKERRKLRQETASISANAGQPWILHLNKRLNQFFTKLFFFNNKREDRFFRKQLKKDANKSQLHWLLRIPNSFIFGIRKLFIPKPKKSKLKQYAVGSWDSRYLISLLFKIKEVRSEFTKSVINSTVLFILAFLAVYYINNYVTIFTAQIFDIPTVLYSYRIFWPLYTYSSLYTRQALVATFGMGPFISLLLAILFLQVPRWLKKYNLNLKLFALWLSFHAFNTVFGGYIAGVITRTGLMYSVEWLFLTAIFDKTEIFLLVIAVIMMFVLGFFSTSYFLMAVNTKIIRESKYRIFYLVGNIAIPWILGNLSLFLLNLPNNPTELLLIYATSILIIIPIFSNYNSPRIQMMKFERIGGAFKIAWIYILITIAAFMYIRMIIYHGISFG
ncbi:MAG: hypothetical protein K8R74_10470 [Bacteroidales bacterium]|nr:hypothetical protein [Bacteroidales bacterium]